MRKKIFTLLLTLTMICGFSMSALAASTYEYAWTSGGSLGKAEIQFRATCIQDSLVKNYLWSSIMTPQNGISSSAFNYKQSGSITFADYTHMEFSTSEKSYIITRSKEMLGGYSKMTATSSNFGGVTKQITANR